MLIFQFIFVMRDITHSATHRGPPEAQPSPNASAVDVCSAGGANSHRPVGSGFMAAPVASFQWVNGTFGKIKSAITGICHKLGPDHCDRCLASFAWRLHLETVISRFIHRAAPSPPLRPAEPSSLDENHEYAGRISRKHPKK
ncbi:MAG: hypothetical protein OXT64_07545 [Gammaproteobacteria bacterium]|nr:hypothetical protein [Gammaproteobacteria bacterium]